MNFYCCVHSQKAIDIRKKYVADNNLKLEQETQWQYICGTNARNDFKDKVINAHDGNAFSKYNQKLRNYTSLLYILNSMPAQKFFFTQCTLFMTKLLEIGELDSDIVAMSSYSPYEPNGQYHSWIDNVIKNCIRKYGEQEVQKFFNDNFYGLDILGKKNNQLRLWMCYVNGTNPFVSELINEAILPFCNSKYIDFFHGDIIPMVLHHLYKTKYSEKIKLIEKLNAKFLFRTPNDPISDIMHYDGK